MVACCYRSPEHSCFRRPNRRTARSDRPLPHERKVSGENVSGNNSYNPTSSPIPSIAGRAIPPLRALIFIHIAPMMIWRESAWISIHDPGGITAMSAGSRSIATNTPGTGDSTEESTPLRGASSGRSALNLSRRLRPLPGSGARGPVDRWCRRVAPQPPANGSVSLRDVDKDQASSPRSAEARLRPAADGLTARGSNAHPTLPAISPSYEPQLQHYAQLLSSTRVKPLPSQAESSLRTPG